MIPLVKESCVNKNLWTINFLKICWDLIWIYNFNYLIFTLFVIKMFTCRCLPFSFVLIHLWYLEWLLHPLFQTDDLSIVAQYEFNTVSDSTNRLTVNRLLINFLCFKLYLRFLSLREYNTGSCFNLCFKNDFCSLIVICAE